MKLLRRLWSLLPTVLLGASLLLHLATLILYLRLPIRFAAFTVFPVWVWGFIGLALAVVPFLFFRKTGSLFLCSVWTVTILILSDEAKSLGRLGKETIHKGPAPLHAGSKVLRVATLNCAGHTNPGDAIGEFAPDIVFLQEMPHAYRLKQFIDDFFEGQGDYRYSSTKGCAVVTRGSIHHNVPLPRSRGQLVAVELPDGRQIELVNIHLQSAATNLKLYRRDCWWEHRKNRSAREIELGYVLATLKQHTDYPRIPTLIAGDFNAPANDSVHRTMERRFTDAFGAVGTGWGNTYHRDLPLLRIDQIYCSDKFLPVRSRTFTVDDSDHRLVIADLIYR
jgi:endonuclease/exonuclease/phosphatase family metal-dependent hydrolase